MTLINRPRNLHPGGSPELQHGGYIWGEYATVGDLPNVSDDGDDLFVGDLATVLGLLYQCRVITSNSAIWHPVAALAGSTRVFTQPVTGNAGDLATVGVEATIGADTDLDYAEFEVLRRMLSTGAACLNGTTVGTNKVRYLLFDEAGVFIIGTPTAGETSAGADIFQEDDWTSTVILSPGKYHLGLKVNGTTATHQRASAASPMNLGEREGSHVFADNDDIASLATGFTADRLPIGYIF